MTTDFNMGDAFSDDLKGIIDILRRRGVAFFLGFVPVIGLALVWLYFSVPLFTASASIILDPRRVSITSAPEVLSEFEPNAPAIDTHVELIQSQLVLGNAIDALGIQNVIAASTTNAPGESSDLTRNELIDLMRGNLDVRRVGLTYLIEISYTDQNSEYAAEVANAVTASYLEHQLAVRQQATKDATVWLSEHVGELRQQVEAAEAAVQAYRSRSGLLVAQGSTSTESQLTNLDQGLNEARKDLSDAQARLAGYRSALAARGPEEAAEVFSAPVMQQLRAQYGTLTNQLVQLSPTLGRLHPQMVELNQQLDDLQEQMNAEAHRSIEELESDVTIARNRVDGLRSIRDQSRVQLGEDNAANVELAQLQTNAESLHLLYQAMLTRLQETTAQETLGQINATIVSEAVAPLQPGSQGAKMILAAAVAAGVALGAFFVMIAQLFDNTVVRPEELRRRTRLPILALVPHLQTADLKFSGKRGSPAEMVLEKPMSLFAESFRTLRVMVSNATARNESLIVQITSGTFAEGKTLSSIAFAQTAAMDGMRVLLIDADVRRRSLTECLGIKAEVGLIEVLRGTAELHDAILPGGAKRRPHVLPLSPNNAGPHDLFSSERFNRLLQKLRLGFDVIVIDSAPVLALAEPLSLAQCVDAVVLVARWGKTPITVTLKALEEINRVGGHVAGMLLTHVDIKTIAKQSYGRGYYPALMKYYQQ